MESLNRLGMCRFMGNAIQRTKSKGELETMKMRTSWLAVVAFLLVATIPVHAQSKFEVTPFVGWESSGSYPVSSNSTIDNLRLNSSASFGGFIDYSLSENFQPEFIWARNNTSYSAHDSLTNSYFNAWHTDNDQFQFGGIFLLRNSEVKLRPYIGAGLGFSHEENSNQNPNRTAFSWNIGGGVKYFVTQHIGFRGDIRYMPTYGSSSIGEVCYFGCFPTTVHNYLNRANLAVGIDIKF
jgi:opacity protein-like surface antigen